MVGLGAGRALAAAHRGEVDRLWRPLAWEDVFVDTSSVPGGRACCRALNPCACLLPKQRCLGACSCCRKALKLVQQLLSKLFSSETATTAAAGKIPAAGDKPRGDGSDMPGRRDPGSLLLPTWLDCNPDPSPSSCPATPVLLPPLPRAPW